MLDKILTEKQDLLKCNKHLQKTKIHEKKRMTAMHTYNVKATRGHFSQFSNPYFGNNRSAFATRKLTNVSRKLKGSIFNANKKKAKKEVSQLDLSDLKKIPSFKLSDMSNVKSILSKGNNFIDESKASEDDQIIDYKNKRLPSQDHDIYSQSSKGEELIPIRILKGSIDELEESELNNVASIHKPGNKTIIKIKSKVYTDCEFKKMVEHRKIEIQIKNGNHKSINCGTSNISDISDKDNNRLRVKTFNKKKTSCKSLNRSSTMAHNHVGSLLNLEKKLKGKDFKPTSILNLSGSIKKSKMMHRTPTDNSLKRKKVKIQISIGNSEDKNLNTSIMNDRNKDSFRNISDQLDSIKEFKMKYKSDNVLERLGRKDDDWEFEKATITFEDFKVVRELGRGRFGKVIQVRRKSNGDEFAVKLIQIKKSLDKMDQENLNSESEIFKIISDQFVVKVYYW